MEWNELYKLINNIEVDFDKSYNLTETNPKIEEQDLLFQLF